MFAWHHDALRTRLICGGGFADCGAPLAVGQLVNDVGKLARESDADRVAPGAAKARVGRHERVVSVPVIGATFFLVLGGAGAWVPYFGLYLKRIGYSGAALGLLIAAMTLARVLSAPFWTALADRFRSGERVLVLTSFVSLLAVMAAIWLPVPTLGLVLLLVVFAGARGPIGPLLDAETILALERRGLDARHYGRIRLWGSVGFMVLGVVAGWVADLHPRAPLDLAIAVWIGGAFLTLAFPRGPVSMPVPIWEALRTLAREPFFRPFVAAVVLHGFALVSWDNLIGIHVAAIGLSSRWTGAALGVAMSTEIALMWLGQKLLVRIDPFRVLVMAMGLGALRWVATASTQSPLVLLVAQASHGMVFGAFWIASVEILRLKAPERIRATAQGVLAVGAYGMGAIVAGGTIAVALERIGSDGLLYVSALGSLTAALLALAAERATRP